MEGFFRNVLFLTTDVYPSVIKIGGITSALEGLIFTFSNGVLIIFSASCTILIIVHSFCYVKAEDAQQKQQAKGKIVNLVVGFVCAYAGNAFVKTSAPQLVAWLKVTITTLS